MIKKIFVYILRLLAGKFGTICTEFPLKKFLPKKSNKVSFNVFRQKLLEQNLVKEKLFPLC